MVSTLREALERDRKYYQGEAYRYNQAMNDIAKEVPELLDLEADSVSGGSYSVGFFDTKGEHPGLGSKLLALSEEDHVDYVVESTGYVVGKYHIKGLIVRHYRGQVERPCYKAIIQQEVSWCGDTVPDGEIIEWIDKPADKEPE